MNESELVVAVKNLSSEVEELAAICFANLAELLDDDDVVMAFANSYPEDMYLRGDGVINPLTLSLGDERGRTLLRQFDFRQLLIDDIEQCEADGGLRDHLAAVSTELKFLCSRIDACVGDS